MKEDLLRVELYSLFTVNISTALYQRKRKNVFFLKLLKLNFIFILLMLLLSNPFFSQNIFLKFKVEIKSEFSFLLWIIFNIYVIASHLLRPKENRHKMHGFISALRRLQGSHAHPGFFHEVKIRTHYQPK